MKHCWVPQRSIKRTRRILGQLLSSEDNDNEGSASGANLGRSCYGALQQIVMGGELPRSRGVTTIHLRTVLPND